jgi:signal transduction histidine kinase
MVVDREAISDALLNILNNAFKYTGEDKRIGLAVSASRRWVDISVTDNGSGVPRAEQRKIFERFYRAEDLLTQRTHGSGLGLALAKRIVEAHGGKVLLTSRVGQGATFTLRLPVASERAFMRAQLAESLK